MFGGRWSQSLSLWFVFVTSACSSDRSKRIINGDVVMGRNMGYDAVTYYGAIGTVHGLPFYHFFVKGINYGGDISCGGALLTPEIVQTACHCLSEWEDDESKFIRKPIIEHNWEGYRVVYIGVNDRFGEPTSMETHKPIISKQFLVHQKCGHFRNQMTTHDYGWIMVNSDWTSGTTGVPITNMVGFAPTFSLKELVNIWQFNIERTSVCLHLGFGVYEIDDSDRSPNLLHGWSVMISMEECWLWQVHGIHGVGPTIEQYLNFFCSTNFPKHSQPTGRADSGGPVTCKNLYFGVGSGVSYNLAIPSQNGKVHVNYDGGIIFAPFENALEYRSSFVSFIRDYEKLNYKELLERYENHNRTFKPQVRRLEGIPGKSKSCPSARTNFTLLFFTYYLLTFK